MAKNIDKMDLSAKLSTTEMPKPRSEIYTADELYKMEIPPLRWIIEDLLPVGYHIFAGRPKSGKSIFVLQMALAVASANKFMQINTKPGNVLYLALEDGKGRLKQRIKSLLECEPLENRSFPPNLYLSNQLPKFDRGGYQELLLILNHLPDMRLVIIDTFGKIMPQKRNGNNSFSEDYDFGALFQVLSRERDFALCLIHHTTKAKYDNPLDDVSGSTGTTASADGIYVFRSHEEKTILHITGKDIDTQQILLERSPIYGWTALGDAQTAIMSEERKQVREFIEKNGYSSIREMAQSIDKKEENVRQLLYKMRAKAEIKYDSVSKRYYL